jgi:hypothetical protein
MTANRDLTLDAGENEIEESAKRIKLDPSPINVENKSLQARERRNGVAPVKEEYAVQLTSQGGILTMLTDI